MGSSVKVYGPAAVHLLECWHALVRRMLSFSSFPLTSPELSTSLRTSSSFSHLAKSQYSRMKATTLFESRAICCHICDKYADNASLMGSAEGGVLRRASIDQWLEVESQSFNPPTASLIAQLVFYPQMKLKQDAAAIRDSERKLKKKVLDVYEHRLSENRFLTGEEFSLANLSHLPNAQYLITATDRAQLFTSKKNVARWWEEISKRPSWKKALGMQK